MSIQKVFLFFLFFKLECVGYIVSVSPTKRSRKATGNEYFDIEIQHTPDERKEVRVMIAKGFPMTQRNFFVDKKETMEPVRIKGLSAAPSGTNFLNSTSSVESVMPHECQFPVQSVERNIVKVTDILKCQSGTFNLVGKFLWQGEVRNPSSCSQSVRDALITDESASIPISVWEEHYNKVQNGMFYKFTDVKLRHFQGPVLSTQRFTEIEDIESFDVKEILPSTIICCPNILNGSVNVFPMCNNPVCKKKLIAPAGAVLATCKSCSRKLLLKRAEIDINVSLQIENEKKEIINTTVFPPEIINLFGEEAISQAKENPDELLEKFLLLEHHDFVFTNFRSNIVSSIKKH